MAPQAEGGSWQDEAQAVSAEGGLPVAVGWVGMAQPERWGCWPDFLLRWHWPAMLRTLALRLELGGEHDGSCWPRASVALGWLLGWHGSGNPSRERSCL